MGAEKRMMGKSNPRQKRKEKEYWLFKKNLCNNHIYIFKQNYMNVGNFLLFNGYLINKEIYS